MQHMATYLWLVNKKISAPWSSGCSGLLQSSNNTPTTGRNPSHNGCPRRRPNRFNGLTHPAHDACAAVSLPIMPLQLTWLASGRVSQSEWAEIAACNVTLGTNTFLAIIRKIVDYWLEEHATERFVINCVPSQRRPAGCFRGFIFVLQSMGKVLFGSHGILFSCNTTSGHWRKMYAAATLSRYSN